MVSRNDAHLVEFAVMMCVFGGGLVFNALDRYRRKLKIEDTATVPIRSAPQGFVELQGYAWSQEGSLLNSVLANSKAVYYSLIVEKKIQRRNSKQWEIIFKEQSSQGFLIADSSGVAFLNPDNAECDVTRDVRLLKNLNSEEHTRLRTHLATNNVVLNESFFESYRVTESQIRPGSPLCITGFFRSTQAREKIIPSAGLEKFLLQLSISNKAPLWAMQHPIAVGESTTTSTESIPICYGMVSSNVAAKEKLFFADCHRGELLNRLANHLELKIIGGSLLITTGLLLIFFHIHLI